MLDQKNGHIKVITNKTDGIHQFLSFIGVHTCSRLIQKKKLRLCCQCSGNLQLSLFTIRKVGCKDTHLFTGTIADNIRYGRPDATDEDIRAAARLANADSFIRHLPQGYDTVITGDGGSLSQGERQLLAIARAAVSDPPVLILDEATSSIDTRTETLIEQGMDSLMEGRTVFVIAHRLSTVRNSQAILVLEHGRIIERGDHQELLAQKGKYYQLYTGKAELS